MEVIASYLLIQKKCINSKQKNSRIKPYPSCLGNTLKEFTLNNMKQTKLKGSVKVSSFDYNVFDNSNILDIYRYLMAER